MLCQIIKRTNSTFNRSAPCRGKSDLQVRGRSVSLILLKWSRAALAGFGRMFPSLLAWEVCWAIFLCSTMNLITSKCQQRKMEHTEAFPPCYLAEEMDVSLKRLWSELHKRLHLCSHPGLRLDSTPPGYKSGFLSFQHSRVCLFWHSVDIKHLWCKWHLYSSGYPGWQGWSLGILP